MTFLGAKGTPPIVTPHPVRSDSECVTSLAKVDTEGEISPNPPEWLGVREV